MKRVRHRCTPCLRRQRKIRLNIVRVHVREFGVSNNRVRSRVEHLAVRLENDLECCANFGCRRVFPDMLRRRIPTRRQQPGERARYFGFAPSTFASTINRMTSRAFSPQSINSGETARRPSRARSKASSTLCANLASCASPAVASEPLMVWIARNTRCTSAESPGCCSSDSNAAAINTNRSARDIDIPALFRRCNKKIRIRSIGKS